MPGAADLAGAAVNLQHLRSDPKARLLSLLRRIEGAKCIVLDPVLSGPLNLILQAEGSREMKEQNVQVLHELNWADLDVDCETIVYLVRPHIKQMKQLANQIRVISKRDMHQASRGQRVSPSGHVENELRSGGTSFHVIFTPKRSLECEQILDDESVMQYLQGNLHDFQLGLIPFDNDVLSMEYENAFCSLSVHGDRAPLLYVAQALLDLQAIFGPIPNIQAKGNWSKSVIDMMLRMRTEVTTKEEALAAQQLKHHGGGFDHISEQAGFQHTDLENVLDPASGLNLVSFIDQAKGVAVPEIDNLILIDRSVDMVTPMCTALTYEALVDEIFGIQHSHVKLDQSIIGGDSASKTENKQQQGSPATSKESLSLNSNDKLFSEIRDLNVTVLMRYLNERAKHMKEDREQLDKSKEVAELHAYVKRLPQMQAAIKSLSIHINITQRISSTTIERAFRARWHAERSMLEGELQLDYIEECIARQEPLIRVLRLLCLQSLTNNGIKSHRYDSMRKDILQLYGFEVLFTLHNLEACGLLKKREGSNPWSAIRKAFNLIVDQVDTAEPDDVAYVTSGYAPLSVRVVENAITPGWKHKVDALKLLPGATICDVKQPGVSNPVVVDSVGEEDVGEQQEQKSSVSHLKSGRKVLVVFYVGGVTYAEISALRFLSQQPGCPYDIIVATTKIINGSSFLNSLKHEISSNTINQDV